MSSQVKSEKQAIDAKIAKVREIVRGVSNNDIALALHNNDMDVVKTIHAFTTGGADAALGDWTQKGGASKKNKKKKGKATNAADSSSATSTTTETPKLSSVSAPRTAATNSAPVQTVKLIKHNPDSKPLSTSELDSLLHSLDIKSARIHKNIDDAYAEQSAIISTIQAALNARERQLLAHLEQNRQQIDAKVHQQRTTIQKYKSGKPSAEELARLKNEHESLDSWLEASKFKVHGEKAIKAIEKLGSSFLPAEPVHYRPQPPAVHHHQINGTVTQEKPVKNGQSVQHPPAQPKPQQNGKPVNKHVNGTDIKHSVSHSSLASEEDSGVGHISPVSQEKNVAHVSEGGFSFVSDALNADQLANIKAQVAKNLEAQGIDPSILAIIASSDSAAPPRRRQNQQARAKDNGKPTNKENKKPAGKAVKS
ncbi:hypothetical protein M3Y97_00408700 [Aphelenchoides bicaudatus]|nr:hypothetical protein M3Y97_00408700 [Aphelenchoides bicaudatus]